MKNPYYIALVCFPVEMLVNSLSIFRRKRVDSYVSSGMKHFANTSLVNGKRLFKA